MLNKLRHRLILSHLVPYLVILPIIGMVIIYLVESQVILVDVASELTGQGVLVAELVQTHPQIWTDSAAAQTFSSDLAAKLNTRLMLLSPQGVLLSSSDPSDPRVGQPLALPRLETLVPGQIDANIHYSQQWQEEVVDVIFPVVASDGTTIGIVRLSRQLADVYDRFTQFRLIIVGVLAGGLLLTILLGWGLSLNLERPLHRLTDAVQQMVSHGESHLLLEQGPQEIRVLQRAFNQLTIRLNDLEQVRRRLVANLVHELGRSLGALRAGLQALLHGGSKDPALEHDLLAGMDEETKQLRRLLDDLANLQDVLSGNLELDPQPMDVSEWLPIALRPWEALAYAKGLKWMEVIPLDLPLILADSVRLDQALGNLLSNAVKFTPEGASVSVRAFAEGERLAIQVQDTGPGIPWEEQDRIFMPFYQSNRGALPAKHGMGLGLSIARELIVGQGGEIRIESKPGHGSYFTIWMPIAPTDLSE